MPIPPRRVRGATPPSPGAQARRGTRGRGPQQRAIFSVRLMDALSVVVRRAGVVEARHRVHAVAVQDGAVVDEAGDSGLVCFMRSSSKPLQALPLVRARDDLDDAEVAIASASHRAEPAQIEAVLRLLAKAPADVSQ